MFARARVRRRGHAGAEAQLVTGECAEQQMPQTTNLSSQQKRRQTTPKANCE